MANASRHNSKLSIKPVAGWSIAAVLVGLALFVLGWILATGTVNVTWELNFSQAGELSYAIAFAILMILAIRIPSGLNIGFQNMAIVAAYVTMGPLAAASVSLMGAPLAEIGALLFRRTLDIPRASGKLVSGRMLFRVSTNVYAILVAGLVYKALGGPDRVMQLDAQLLVPAVALFAINVILTRTPRLLFLYHQEKLNRQELNEALPEILFAEVFPMPLAFLLSISFYKLTLAGYLFDLGGTLVTAVLFRTSQYSRLVLKRRVKQLATLNSVSQALSSSLSLDDLIQMIYEQVNRLLDAPTFFIALYDEETQSLSFPIIVKNRQRVGHEYVPTTANSPAEYIIHNRRPLLFNGEVFAKIRALGINPVGPEPACYLAVPLLAGDEVIGVLSVQHPTNPDAFGFAEEEVLSTVAAQAATALQNAKHYKRLSEAVDELALLNNISSIVTSTLDLKMVLDTTCAVATTLGKANKAAIFLTDEAGSSLHIAYSLGLSEDYVAQFRNLSSDAASGPMQVIRQREPMAISDIRTDRRAVGWRTLAEIEGYAGLLTVPLTTSGSVIGFLAAFYTEPHQFAKDELDLMNTLANQVAVAVANARLFNDAQSRSQEMAQLAEASRAFAGSLDLEQVAETVLDSLASVFSPDLISLMMLEAGTNTLRVVASRGTMALEALAPSGSVVSVLNTNKSATLPNSNEDLELLNTLGLQSLYIIPLLSKEKAFGVAMIGHKSTRWFNARDRQLGEALVNQAAVAMQNAQRFGQADAALADRITELSAIEAISRKISGSLDLEEIINDVLDVAEKVTRADFAECALVSSPSHLTMVERHGATQPDSQEADNFFSQDIGVIGRVMRTGKAARVGDVRSDPDYITPPDTSGFLSELCVPIVHNGQHVGVINLESRRLNAFSESDEQFLVNLAEHAAVAIGNARLFDERNHQIDTLLQFRKLSIDLLQANSLQEVMEWIIEHTLLLSKAKNVHLYLYDRKTDMLSLGASLWLDGRENVEIAPLVRGGMPWQVAHTGIMQMIVDPTRDQIAGIFENSADLKIGAIASISIKRTGVSFGVLNMIYEQPHYFTEDELRVLDLVANQAAIAIEDSRLFDEVRKGRDQMQVILDSTRDGMILIGVSGEIVLANPAAERLLNYPMRKYQGRNMLLQVARARREFPDVYNAVFDKVRSVLEEIREAPQKVTRRAYQLQSSSGMVDVEESTLPVLDNNNRVAGRLLVLRDISQEKSLERFRNEITNMMIHDLRSPLGNVISCLRYMEEMIREQNYDDFEVVISTALISSEDQMRMIEAILEIARLETGQVPLNIGTWPLNAIVQRAITTLEATANESSIRLLNCLPADLPPLAIDEAQVRRVIINLMDNALRHTPSSGEVRVEAFVQPGKPFVQIGIIDTGKGIPIEARERIFEKFVQVPKSAIRGRRGIGLGLTFCKLAVEAHQGRIWVESGPEGGAAFWFTLPIARHKGQEAA